MNRSTAELARRYAQGATLLDLVEEFDWGYYQVREELLAAGVSLRETGPVPPRTPPQLVARYKAGASIGQLADMYGMTYGMTRRMLLREDVELRPRGGGPRARRRGREREA